MNAPVRLLICSDIHYASDAEKKRIHYEVNAIGNPLQRLAVRFYRHFFWLRDPFAHNALLERVLQPPIDPDLVVANGDYSCDSGFIGVADEAARQSARECLGQLRAAFGEKFLPVYGDHELGKISLCSGQGGLRLESLRVARQELALEPIWTRRLGRYLLVAITSSLVALPVYHPETLENEREEWRAAARDHLEAITTILEGLHDEDRVLLFVHDPTALPFLWELPIIRKRIGQIERTIIGHLHSELIFRQGCLMSGFPRIAWGGPTVRRISAALSRAREWRHFNVLLCPSLSGLELTRRGGFYTATIDPDATRGAEFQQHVIRR